MEVTTKYEVGDIKFTMRGDIRRKIKIKNIQVIADTLVNDPPKIYYNVEWGCGIDLIEEKMIED